jgi:hypothetical protein
MVPIYLENIPTEAEKKAEAELVQRQKKAEAAKYE